MCGIFAILTIKQSTAALRSTAIEQAKTLRHRGPDWSGVWQGKTAILVHERLAVVDLESGAQPLITANQQQILAVNGEIYNHQLLREEYADHVYQTASDCEVLHPLLANFSQLSLDDIAQQLNRITGMFAFILYDEPTQQYLIARDPIGIIPLYYGVDELGQFYVASEMKALTNHCQHIQEFPPGHYCLGAKKQAFYRYYDPNWQQFDVVQQQPTPLDALNIGLQQAVKSHLMSDVPYGVLLSGGLDSSLIAAIAQQFSKKRIENQEQSPAWWPQLHSFAIGLADSPDLIAAQQVADVIGTIHHNFHFTVQQGIDALQEVIYHLETYDVTTIRAATPMYLLARKIKAMGIKMVLSGEGADEMFAGYLYFHKAPNAQEIHQETLRKLFRLHQFDCLRANKAMAAWGIETRVPFLDKNFIELAMRLDPQHKLCFDAQGKKRMEKHSLRQAFTGWLPDSILWRQKEQFSDGVGYNWINELKAHSEQQVPDQQLIQAAQRFPIHTPQSKEAYFYRSIFESFFPQASAALCVPSGDSVACSTPEALAWDQQLAQHLDPSGRAVLGVHQQAY